MNFGDRLKHLRENLQMSKRQLSRISGVALSYLHEIERGDKSPTLATLEKLSSAIGIPLIDFFTEDDPNELAPDLRQLLREAERLTPEQRRRLIEFIKSMKE